MRLLKLNRFFSEPDARQVSSRASALNDRTFWKRAEQYDILVGAGHQLPPPHFGAPTLVWHIGIWQGPPIDLLMEGETPSRSSFRQDLQSVRETVDRRNEELFTEVAGILERLQSRGRISDAPIDELKFVEADLQEALTRAEQEKPPHIFKGCQPQSLSFTLWWQDDAGEGNENRRQGTPSREDLRVRVHAQTHLEHATISIFIDAGKPWNSSSVYRLSDAVGRRRRRIFECVEAVKRISKGQVQNDYVDDELVPEHLSSSDDARVLEDAADYLYDEIWREFMGAFDFQLPPTRQRVVGEVFAEHRGLILATEGIPTRSERERVEYTAYLRNHLGLESQLNRSGVDATTGIGPFRRFENESGEPNTVFKAYWPFMRRVAPEADRRDFVGCGILEWRCLLLSTLGAPIVGYARDEVEATNARASGLSSPTTTRPTKAIRYLVLTKGEPHRGQIGRFVERINAVETERLFALKHWPTIRNAGVHIRVLGRELDGILSHWSAERLRIDQKYRFGGSVPQPKSVARQSRGKRHPIPSKEEQTSQERRLADLNELIRATEQKLITLGAHLDNIGRGGSGRLLYAIDRSDYFIDEFERMVPTLEIGNVDGWVHYGQFVERGLQPIFDQIRNTGESHRMMRSRLQMITETIQTSALIVEAEATSKNTETLRKIADNWANTRQGLIALTIAVVANLVAVLAENQAVIRALERMWAYFVSLL